jgi:hypothetical protein
MYADGTHLPELSATKVEPPKDFPKSLLLDNWLGLLTNTRDFIPQFSLWGGRVCRVSLPHGFPRPMPAREEQKAAAVSCVLLLLKPRVLSNGICTAAERGQRLPSFSLFQAKRTPLGRLPDILVASCSCSSIRSRNPVFGFFRFWLWTPPLSLGTFFPHPRASKPLGGDGVA